MHVGNTVSRERDPGGVVPCQAPTLEPGAAALACVAGLPAAAPGWVDRILDRCESQYVGSGGVLVSVLGATGNVIDETPLVADFGDVLPFAWHFGRRQFARAQLQAAAAHLDRGLFRHGGRTRLFSNHDWLLGLLDLYRQSGDAQILGMAQSGARTLGQHYFCNDLLLDELPTLRAPRSLLQAASPFNGGYIELWLELFAATGDPVYRQWAERLGQGWCRTRAFMKQCIFSRTQSARSAVLATWLEGFSTMKARLFKDNTNLVWGLLALCDSTGDPKWRAALERWVAGFETRFWNRGQVCLLLDQQYRGHEVSIKAGFSSLDLLCDLHRAGIAPVRTLELATSIADYWLDQQWRNGLFPEHPGGDRDHLDANVDLVVALWKLGALTQVPKYVAVARKCAQAVLDLHETPAGYCLAIGPSGEIRDARIIVKYQTLLTKLALLPDEPARVFTDPALAALLRDR